MMILHVREMAERQGIKNALQLAVLCGIGNTAAYRLWAGEVDMIALATLDRLCRALQVSPGLLLEYKPDVEGDTGPGPTLQEVITRRPGGPRKPRAKKAKRGKHGGASARVGV